MKICRLCNIEKDESEYYTYRARSGKTYIKGECKSCYSLSRIGKKIKRKPYIPKCKVSYGLILTQEAINFIEEINIKKRGYIDMVDAYKLTNYYVDIFDDYYPIDKITVEEDLMRMWARLNDLYNKKPIIDIPRLNSKSRAIKNIINE